MRLPSALLIAGSMLMQQPAGDRPAGNTRGTRSVVMARNGVIAASQPLAAAAGLRVLQSGGNAIDAAVTAAPCCRCRAPGQARRRLFAIVSAKDHKVHGLNASGRAPALATLDSSHGAAWRIPLRSELSVSVGAWWTAGTAARQCGTRTLAQARPAINTPGGYAVSKIIAMQWKSKTSSRAIMRGEDVPHQRPGAAAGVFGIPRSPFSSEQIAKAETTSSTRAPSRGDRRRHRAETADPSRISPLTRGLGRPITTYRGCQVLNPPNTRACRRRDTQHHGKHDLKALGQQRRICTLVKPAHRVRDRGVDRRSTSAPPGRQAHVEELRGARRKKSIPRRGGLKPFALDGRATPERGADPAGRGDTVYLTAADSDGNVVSLIQSLFEAFGSGIVAGDTGIVLQDRGNLFSLTPGHPNQIAPGRRPFHTLIPAMVMKDGVPWVSFGVMGGDMQAQGHAQILANLIDFAQDQPFSQSGPTVNVLDPSTQANLYQVLRWIYLGAFVHDDFKVTKRLTLNLGLRYDYFGHWGNYHNSTTPFPFFNPGAGTDFADQVTAGTMGVRGGSNAYVTDNTPMA